MIQGETVKDETGSHAVFTEQGSSASQMAAKGNGCPCKTCLWTSSRSSIRLHGRMEDAPKLLKIPKNVQISGYVLYDTSGQVMVKHRRSRGSSSAKFLWRPTCPLDNFKISIWTMTERKYRIGSASLSTEDKDYSYQYTWMMSK